MSHALPKASPSKAPICVATAPSSGRSSAASTGGCDTRRSEPFRGVRGLVARGARLLPLGLLALWGCGGIVQVTSDSGGGSGTGGAGGASTSSSSSTSTSSTSSTSTSSTSTSSTSSTSTSSTSSSTSSGPVEVTVLPEESVYRYWDQGSVAPEWFNPAFDDSGWSSGPGPLGFGDAYIATTVGFGPNPDSKYISTWFRTTFDVPNAGAVVAATIELKVDDGAVVFLNGNEWVRWNMPNGAITQNTMASSILEAADEGFFIAFDVNPSLLVDGENVLAIEVHQAIQNSTDLGIDSRITLLVN